MLYLKKSISELLTGATAKAFPVSEIAEIKNPHRKADYLSNIPSVIYDKYKKEQHAFGLFNSREIADSIFVNCPKVSWIKQIQVSGTGDLEIFISEKYMLSIVNNILSSQTLSFISPTSDITRNFIISNTSNNSEISISCARGLFIIETLKNLHKLHGSLAYTYIVAYDFNPSKRSLTQTVSEYISDKLTSNPLRLTEKDKKKLIMDQIIDKINPFIRLILTSDLHDSKIRYEISQDNIIEIDVKKDIEENNEKMYSVYQEWPWMKYAMLSLSPISQKSQLSMFYKYYRRDLSKKLEKFMKIFDSDASKYVNFSSYGDVFFNMGSSHMNEKFYSILKYLEAINTPHIPHCYNIEYISLASLKYFMLKHSRNTTFAITTQELLEKSSKSLWAILAVYKYLKISQEPQNFKLEEIHGEVRLIFVHIFSLPDAIEECLNGSSAHFLIEWIENLCEFYIRADYHILSETREKVDCIMKICIEFTLKLVGIDINKIYASNL